MNDLKKKPCKRDFWLILRLKHREEKNLMYKQKLNFLFMS